MNEQPKLIEAKTLLFLVGVIAFFLPFVLIGFNAIVNPDDYYLTSISGYFYSRSKVAFIGSMCAISMFFFAYRGYKDNLTVSDNLLSNAIGWCALMVAIFPTPPDNPSHTQKLIGIIHFSSAALFLGLLAFMAIKRFTLTGNSEVTALKKKQQKVYRICGWTMIVTLITMAVLYMTIDTEGDSKWRHFVLWGEIICLWAFGIAWAVKGELIPRLKKQNIA